MGVDFYLFAVDLPLSLSLPVPSPADDDEFEARREGLDLTCRFYSITMYLPTLEVLDRRVRVAWVYIIRIVIWVVRKKEIGRYCGLYMPWPLLIDPVNVDVNLLPAMEMGIPRQCHAPSPTRGSIHPTGY